jgi:hypothetical protein
MLKNFLIAGSGKYYLNVQENITCMSSIRVGAAGGSANCGEMGGLARADILIEH